MNKAEVELPISRRIDALRSSQKAEREPRSAKNRMTPDRLNVLKLLCEGHCYKRIATKLGKKHNCVKRHGQRLLKMTGCKTMAQLGVWAVRQGYV